MNYRLKRIAQRPFIHCRNKIVIEINDEFSRLTGYAKVELLGKSLNDLNKMIRISSQFDLTTIDYGCSCFMFTKECEPREITIMCKTHESQNDQIFIFKEKPNSRIEDRLPYADSLLLHNEIGVAIYSIPDGIFLKTNKMFLDFWNYEANEIESIRVTQDLLKGYEGSRYKKMLIDVLKTEKPFYVKEAKLKDVNRSVTYWDISIVPVYREGEATYIIHTAVDVTLNILNSKIVKERKEELEEVIENMSDEVVIFNANCEYTILNKAWRENSVLDITKVKDSKSFFEQVEIYDVDRNLIPFENMPSQRVFRGERFSQYKLILKDNKGIYDKEFSGTPIYDGEGNFISGVLVGRDIGDRLKKEEHIFFKSQYNLLSNMLENWDVGIARYSYPQFKIIDINNRACKAVSFIDPKFIFKFNHIGKDAFHCFPKQQKNELTEDIKRLVEKKQSSYITQKILFGKKEKYIKLFFQPLIGFKNKIVEIIVTFIDITEEVDAKNKIEEALKLQDKIFANVAHELKTPLNVIFTANQLMELYLREDSLESNKEVFVRSNVIVKQNCYRQIKLIENITDLAKIESGYFKFNPIYGNIVDDVETLVQSVSKTIKGKGLRIIFDTDLEEKMMVYDLDIIERIILNLISNALKFSNAEGEIIINITDKYEAIEISVKDMGIGMNKKQVNSIFKKFYQADKALDRKSEGNGIGLSLVKSLVEMHSGNVSVESEIGKGSIFRIQLPTNNRVGVKNNPQYLPKTNKIEMINIELSDIYSI